MSIKHHCLEIVHNDTTSPENKKDITETLLNITEYYASF